MFISILGTVTDEKGDIHESQAAEEEVHWGLDVRVQPDEQDDEQVPQHRGQVHAQEQGKEHALMLWLDGAPQEEELRHMALVLPSHADIFSSGNEEKAEMSGT